MTEPATALAARNPRTPPLRVILTTLAALALSCAYLSIWAFAGLDAALLRELVFVPLVGVGGALVANSTGVGGGVVFIPVFNSLRDAGVVDLGPAEIVGVSFLIQSFGMSVGALTWANRLHTSPAASVGVPLRQFWWIVLITWLAAAPTLLVTQGWTAPDPRAVLFAFKGFSIVLGVILLASLLAPARPDRTAVAPVDLVACLAIGLVGGPVTALFSVGVGEFLALYLFIRGYGLSVCAGAAVVVSALTVLTGAPFHVLNTSVSWEIVALAAPGAMAGGFLARRLAHGLGPTRLKLFAGLWIVTSSAYLILAAV